MYRLLIVDDEPIIADGLQEVLREEFRDALDVCKAYAAEEAIDWLDRTRVDILLSDICMPRMDGLALLEQVHARWPACRVIFLTGHGSFDSVYTAIQYPNVSYLLKMEGYDKVIQTVREVAAELDRTFAREALLRDAQTRSLRARELMREQYLDGVLNGRFHQHEINLDQLGELQIPLRPDWPVLLLLGRVENMRRDLPWSEKNRKMYGIRQLADRCFGTRMRYIEWADATDHLVWLLQPPSPDLQDEKGNAPPLNENGVQEALPDKVGYEPALKNLTAHKNVLKAMEAKDTSILNAEEQGYYDNIQAFLGGNREKWGDARIFGSPGSFDIIGKYVDSGDYLYNAFYGSMTPTMVERMATLEAMEAEVFTKIIMGDPIENFDKFVTDWNNLGGADITREVNDWAATVK